MADAGDGAASALALALRVDAASLVGDEADVSLLDARVKMDVADDGAVAAGLAGALFVASGGASSGRDAARTLEEARTAAGEKAARPLELLVDAADAGEAVADVKWVNAELLAAGYSSGVVRVFGRDGRLRFEQKLHSVKVLKLDINHCVSIVGARRPFGGGAQRDSELWILYEDATIAIVQLAELLGQINAAMFGPAQASKFRKYSLRDQSDILAAVPCGSVRPTIFQAHARIGVHSIISVGSGPFISFYQAGNDQNSIVHLAHIATAMATRAAGAVWNFAKSWGWGGSKGDDGELQQAAASYAQIGSGAIDAAAEHVPAPINSSRGIFDDERRRCRVLVLSPNGRLAAISDTLGRIMLVDTSRMIIIRMWKGYRYAQCGWMQAVEGARRPQGLYLVIYSAQRGIVEVWRAQYGPRVFTLAVGDSARLFTRVDPVTRKAKCFIVTKADDRMSDVFELKPGLPTPAILMKYFTQNRLQEENFLLHQIIGGLHAFVKKRGDKSEGSGSVPLDTLLDDIGKLSSLATFDSLLEVLLNADMAPLGAPFLLKALEKIEMTLTSNMVSRSPTGQEILFGWNIQWLHRLVHAFIGFETEFRRSYRGFLSNTEGKSLREAVAAKVQTGELTRLIPWLELYRRAGFIVDDDSRVKTRKVVEAASRLNAWVFLEYFSMPFGDPELARRRDILALHEDAESREAFSREVFHTLQLSVLRSFPSAARKDCFLAFIFVPVLSSVFAVQEIQSLHDSIFLPRATQTSLFLEWFFSLPLGVVLGLPSPAQSSALQRWLQPLLATSASDEVTSSEHDETTSEGAFAPKISVRHLLGCSPDMKAVFSACWRTSKLFHAFILSQYCCWGEVQAAKHMEEATLGRITSVGSGMRWRVLEDCIAKTVHLSLRLGRAGRLTVEAVEHVDEIMRAVAVMQINSNHEPGEDDLTIPPSNPTGSGANGSEDVDLDGWVADMEHYRNAQAMKDWSAVLGAFPQFSDADALCCFRVSVLCAAWNSERSDMQQLEDALLELDALSGLTLKAALAVYIWEKYIRVHVVTLISFWEESAAGRKPQRGLQPQVARRFFGIIKNLLLILSTCTKSLRTSPSVDHQAFGAEVDDVNDDDDDDEETSDETQKVVGYRLSSLAEDSRWVFPVSELRAVYGRRWPPSRNDSALMRTLATFDFRALSLDQITDHTSLILLLDSFAATAVTPVSIVKLFPNRGGNLCRPNTFMASSVAAETVTHQHLEEFIQRERSAFLKQLVRYDETLGFSLAEAFGLSLEGIREEHVVFLYQSGQDELGDLWIDKMKHPDRLVSKLGSIARARLAIILQRMKAEPKYAMIMSVLPADVFLWIINSSQPPLVADPVVESLDRAPSLTATHHLLLQCLALIPAPEGEEFEKVSAMSVLVKDVISQVKQQQGGQAPS